MHKLSDARRYCDSARAMKLNEKENGGDDGNHQPLFEDAETPVESDGGALKLGSFQMNEQARFFKKLAVLSIACAVVALIGCRTKKEHVGTQRNHAIKSLKKYKPVSQCSGLMTIPSEVFHASILSDFSRLPNGLRYTLKFTKNDGTEIDIRAKCEGVNQKDETVTFLVRKEDAQSLRREWRKIRICQKTCRRTSKHQFCIIGPAECSLESAVWSLMYKETMRFRLSETQSAYGWFGWID